MNANNITHKAFLVVRYCSPEKLGENRLTSYLSAAEALQKQKPYNTITRSNQLLDATKTFIKEKSTENQDGGTESTPQKQETSKNQRAYRKTRGGGRGTRGGRGR